MGQPKARRSARSQMEDEPFSEKDFRELYTEKLAFCRDVLHLSEGKAKEWATRSVNTIRSLGELKRAS